MSGLAIAPTAFDPAVSLARQSLYRFAAVSLLDPRAGAWDQLAALRDDPLLVEAAALIRDLPDAIAEYLALGERPLAALDPTLVLQRLPASLQELNDEFEHTFGLLVSNACPPYETEYINSKFTFQRSNTLADVNGFYRAFGLMLTDVYPERPDHIVLELEFMGLLSTLERRAAAVEGRICGMHAEVCQNAQRRFLREHLAWWTPAFARLLSREDRGGIYEAVGEFLSAWIPAERALLGVDAPSGPAAPSSVDRPESCEGCQLGAIGD